MKKLILFISLLISLFLLTFNNIYASASWKYVWFNTVVEIPIGDSVENYKDKPYAILYKNNVALTDTNITYSKDGDWLYYLKNVNTQKLGEYKVWYKAYDSVHIPGTCVDYKCLITFVVKDNIKPEVEVINDTLYLPIDSSYEFRDNIIAKDNYGIKDIKFKGKRERRKDDDKQIKRLVFRKLAVSSLSIFFIIKREVK